MIKLTQKNEKKVLINPTFISHFQEIKEDKTEVYFAAASSMADMGVTVIESIDDILFKIENNM